MTNTRYNNTNTTTETNQKEMIKILKELQIQ